MIARLLLLSAIVTLAKPALAEEPRVIAGFLGIGGALGTNMARPPAPGAPPQAAQPPAHGNVLGLTLAPDVGAAVGALPPLRPNPNDPGDVSDITARFAAIDANPRIPIDIKARLKEELIRESLARKAHAAQVAAAQPNPGQGNTAQPQNQQYRELRGTAGFGNNANAYDPIPTMPEPGFQGGGATTAR